MSLGVLDRQNGRRHRGPLGAYTSTIPAECWNQTGFKDCHTKAYAQAQSECASQGLTNDDDCIGPAADSITMQTCGCKVGAKPATTTTKPKTVVTSSSSSTTPGTNPFAPDEATILGMPMKTVAIIGLGAVAFYVFTQQKGSKS